MTRADSVQQQSGDVVVEGGVNRGQHTAVPEAVCACLGHGLQLQFHVVTAGHQAVAQPPVVTLVNCTVVTSTYPVKHCIYISLHCSLYGRNNTHAQLNTAANFRYLVHCTVVTTTHTLHCPLYGRNNHTHTHTGLNSACSYLSLHYLLYGRNSTHTHG